MYPEYVHGLHEQGMQPGPEYLLGIGAWEAEKRGINAG